MVPGALSSSDSEVDWLVDSNKVYNPGWFEGRAVLRWSVDICPHSSGINKRQKLLWDWRACLCRTLQSVPGTPSELMSHGGWGHHRGLVWQFGQGQGQVPHCIG